MHWNYMVVRTDVRNSIEKEYTMKLFRQRRTSLKTVPCITKAKRSKLTIVVSFFFILSFFIPAISLSENTYTPKLEMTMDEFILKYNALPATLESPYKSLGKPILWTNFNEYQVAWFYPESSSSIAGDCF